MNSNRKRKETFIYGLVLAGVFLVVGGAARGDFTFGNATNLGLAINTPTHDYGGLPSRDGLSLFCHHSPLDWSGIPEGWIAQRATKQYPWDDAVYVGSFSDVSTLVTVASEVMGGVIVGGGPDDNLEAYITSPDGYGAVDISVLKRQTVDADFGPPVKLGPTVNTSKYDAMGWISPDGLTLFFSSNGLGGYGRSDIYVTTRATRSDDWGVAKNLGPEVNSSSMEYEPTLSADGLLLFFVSDRPGGSGDWDIWMTRRTSLSDPWVPAVNLGPEVNSYAREERPELSADGSTLYWCGERPGGYGGYDIWQATIESVVDLNSDGIVDAADMCIIVDNWGTDNSLCDIGPMPWGDGVVDVHDLVVLSEHLFEVTSPVE